MSATPIAQLPSFNAHRLLSFTTRYPADAVACLPQTALVAVGGYELSPATGAKVGDVSLHSLTSASATALTAFELKDRAAVFDLRWLPSALSDTRPPLLAVADAGGAVSFHSLHLPCSASDADDARGPPTPTFSEVARAEAAQLTPPSASSPAAAPPSTSPASCLFLDWNEAEAAAASASPSLAVSLSSGAVSVLSLLPSSSRPSLLSSYVPHSLEVWSLAFSTATPTSLYSGADDCRLCRCDLRCAQPSLLSTHPAGVTALLPLSSASAATELLLSGCYDERLRLWDTRRMRQPVEELRMGGGVWRIRRRPKGDSAAKEDSRGGAEWLCVAGMHGGVKVVRMEGEGSEARLLSVCSAYHAHDSLAYGCDWVAPEGEVDVAVVSCSFYDRAVHCWRPGLG